MNREFLDDFLTEAREHLSTAEEDILTLERNGTSADPETVNRLFRAVHTIKGGAGLLELHGIKDLSHNLENVMGRIRNGTLASDAGVVEVLLKGLDRLHFLIDNVEDESLEIEDEVAALRGLLEEKPTSESRGASSEQAALPLFELGGEDLEEARKQRMHVFDCVVDLRQECSAKNRLPAELAAAIRSIGRLIAMEPDLDSLSLESVGADATASCRLLFSSVIEDPDVIGEGLGIGFARAKAYAPSELPEPATRVPGDEIPKKKSSNREEQPAAKDSGGLERAEGRSAPAAETPAKDAGSGAGRERRLAEQTVRISLPLLDQIMNLAGELVLVRNQNVQAIASRDLEKIAVISQHLNVVTTELQASIMQTRMRPVGGVFSRFTRVVRDLARKLGKEVTLDIAGSEVELDKNIVEAIADPLTHLIRNAVDHGIEMPDERRENGKNAVGTIRLSAFHESGQVNIRIVDDGKGMDPEKIRKAAVSKGVVTSEQAEILTERESFNLIFAPGFSTAEKVTDVSGRGVGMDVVKATLQRLGGAVDISSNLGKGTAITIKLPLTLAILPSLIVEVEECRFAIPQVNIDEVVWLHGDEAYQNIQIVDNREIYRLRGKLYPLLRLSEVLGIRKTYIDPETSEKRDDRRAQMTDRRQMNGGMGDERRRGPIDRRVSSANSVYIIVLKIGNQQFGLLVDRIVDTEEIVVKALHDQLKACRAFTGTAVLGDGSIAMILDISSVADLGGMRYAEVESETKGQHSSADEKQTVLLFDIGGKEQFALPLGLITRVEEIHPGTIQVAGSREYLDFRGDLIPVIRIEQAISGMEARYDGELVHVIIPKCGRPIGMVASRIIDTVQTICELDSRTIRTPGVVGTQLLDGRLTLFLDVVDVVERVEPNWFSRHDGGGGAAYRILLVEDTTFYQALVGSYLKGIGVAVTVAGNGREALKHLETEAFDGVISDLEMPVMDGYELARRARASKQFGRLPLVAISAADRDNVEERALEAGFDVFRSKFDLEGMLRTVSGLFSSARRDGSDG